jgi:hypothetical protein
MGRVPNELPKVANTAYQRIEPLLLVVYHFEFKKAKLIILGVSSAYSWEWKNPLMLQI